MIELFLPYPPSVNHYWRNVNGRTIISKAGREYRQAVKESTTGLIGKALEKRLSIDIYAFMPDKRKRDLDNLPKAIFDSLTHAGLWLDDSQIDRFSVHRMPVIRGGQILIEILERE